MTVSQIYGLIKENRLNKLNALIIKFNLGQGVGLLNLQNEHIDIKHKVKFNDFSLLLLDEKSVFSLDLPL